MWLTRPTKNAMKKQKSKGSRKAVVVLKKLGRERCYGLCDYGEGKIKIDPRLRPYPMLDTIIHETLHWLEPTWSEKKVRSHSRQLTRQIWAFKYRQLRELPQ